MRIYVNTEYGWIGEYNLREDRVFKEDENYVYFIETEFGQYFDPHEVEVKGYKDFHKARLDLLQVRKDELVALQKVIENLESAKDYQDYHEKEFPWRKTINEIN